MRIRMEIVGLALLVLLFLGIAAIVQNPFLMLGFGVGAYLFGRGLAHKTFTI